MFFGVRVQPDFLSSAAADEIRGHFRRRIWICAQAIAFVNVLWPWGNSIRPDALFTWTCIICYAPMAANILMFGLAHRETKRQCADLAAPTTRTAALFLETEQSNVWLTILDWLAMLFPVGVPIATAVLIFVHWNRYKPHFKPSQELAFVGQMFVFGVFASATYFALRFRARSTDWAPDARSSRVYRTLLGLVLSTVFTALIFVSCWQSLSGISGEPFGSMHTQHVYIMPIMVSCMLFALALRLHLKRTVARESADPMPNRYWKWGLFYCNPYDSALIVPSRSGSGFSYNYASHAVWFFSALVVALLMWVWVSAFLTL